MRARPGTALPAWQPVTWELSSHLALLALVPAVFAFERRFPLTLGRPGAQLAWHVAGSVVFSLAHVALMVGLRHVVYAWAGSRYDFGDWLAKLALRIPEGRAHLCAVPASRS